MTSPIIITIIIIIIIISPPPHPDRSFPLLLPTTENFPHSKGIGLEVSIELAKRGYKVYASMRDPVKSGSYLETKAEGYGLRVTTSSSGGDHGGYDAEICLLPLDVQNPESIAVSTSTAPSYVLNLFS